MKKILFATEFSDHSLEVFKFATELAFHFKAQLIVTHAFGKPGTRDKTQEEIEHMEDVTMDQLNKFVTNNTPKEYRNKLEIGYMPKVGLATDVILELAVEENVDLIVIGLTGKTNALDSLIGNTSLNVIAKAPMAVLGIPATATFEGIDNIAYINNFGFDDLGAINYLRKWAKKFEASVHCLHVMEKDVDESQVVKYMSILKEVYKTKKWLTFNKTKGVFKEEVERFAKGKKADIILMMSFKFNLLTRLVVRDSVQGIARIIKSPILVIKDSVFEINS